MALIQVFHKSFEEEEYKDVGKEFILIKDIMDMLNETVEHKLKHPDSDAIEVEFGNDRTLIYFNYNKETFLLVYDKIIHF